MEKLTLRNLQYSYFIIFYHSIGMTPLCQSLNGSPSTHQGHSLSTYTSTNALSPYRLIFQFRDNFYPLIWTLYPTYTINLTGLTKYTSKCFNIYHDSSEYKKCCILFVIMARWFSAISIFQKLRH